MAIDRGSDVTRTAGQSAQRSTTARTGTSQPRTGRSKSRSAAARRHRAFSLAAKIAGVTGGTVLLVVGLLYARLLAGPISLTFLTSHIQQALEREFAGLGVDIEDVSARLSEAGTVAFELTNIRVSDAAGSPLAFAPSASLSLSRKSAEGRPSRTRDHRSHLAAPVALLQRGRQPLGQVHAARRHGR